MLTQTAQVDNLSKTIQDYVNQYGKDGAEKIKTLLNEFDKDNETTTESGRDEAGAKRNYDELKQSIARYIQFANFSNQLLRDLFDAQSKLKDSIEDMKNTFSGLQGFVRDDTIRLNDKSNDLLDKLNEGDGKTRVIFDNLKELIKRIDANI